MMRWTEYWNLRRQGKQRYLSYLERMLNALFLGFQTQRDYLQEWVDNHCQEWLNILLDIEAPRNARACDACGTEEGAWRCLECIGQPTYCKECCRTQHLLMPFHRVSKWHQTHFSPDWLWATGTTINLGHSGALCPNAMGGGLDGIFAEDDEVGEVDPDHPLLSRRDFTYNSKPPGATLNGHNVVTVVHTNGIHHLPVVRCGCPGRDGAVVEDLLRLNMCPASFTAIRTVFTTDVLEDSRLCNFECHTTSLQYYQKLRRLTNPAFPESVPVNTIRRHFRTLY